MQKHKGHRMAINLYKQSTIQLVFRWTDKWVAVLPSWKNLKSTQYICIKEQTGALNRPLKNVTVWKVWELNLEQKTAETVPLFVVIIGYMFGPKHCRLNSYECVTFGRHQNFEVPKPSLTRVCLFFFSPKPRHAVKLLSVLKYMAHRTGPDSFFSFPGKNAAVSSSQPPPPPPTHAKQHKIKILRTANINAHQDWIECPTKQLPLESASTILLLNTMQK